MQTKPTSKSVAAFLGAIEDDQRRKDSKAVAAMMKRVSGETPKMWGPGIVGYGHCNYTYASGREGEMPMIAFAPRRNDVTLYIDGGFPRYAKLMTSLGRYTNGKGCLHIRKLADVDLAVLEALARASFEHTAQKKAGGLS